MNATILQELRNRHSKDAVTAMVAWFRLCKGGFAEHRAPRNGEKSTFIGTGLIFTLNAAGRLLEQEALKDRT
jgi:hypothetical protein